MTAIRRGALKQLKHHSNTFNYHWRGIKQRTCLKKTESKFFYVGRAKRQILAFMELPASPDLVTITTILIFFFFPMTIPQYVWALLNIHGHNRTPGEYALFLKKCVSVERRETDIHTLCLNFLIFSMFRNKRVLTSLHIGTCYWWKRATIQYKHKLWGASSTISRILSLGPVEVSVFLPFRTFCVICNCQWNGNL